ncbi:TPA: YqaJ viral recombinase family protein [Stenotrophomonas maltophilia]|nr:YqaJ viral recombinase family protein [Stenotrophomonas maltophilia]HEL3778680.1 YqaJ viral recombinase family protein [Stenotrophomonas maltophilia]HEL5006650.1 YqaJ viral recombinase family protein [Stenotrophomonas maltophilia]
MITVDYIQGTQEWHAHRAQHLNASDAPAMLGASTNHSRTDLIRELAAGVPREFSDFVQERVIDPGHEFEAQARAIAEQLVGEDLYPVTGVAGKYSASFDGLTLLEDIAWEHKRLNQTLRDAMFDGCTGTDLPLMYQIQMEHQAMVSECERVFFMASEWRQASGGWELVEERHCWYTPNPELRARIVAGWAQLEADVAAFEPGPASEPVPVGRAPESLPALSIQVTGMVTASNLAEFKENALAVLGSINRELQSDEDFANAEKTVTWCKGVEERIEATKQQVLGQTADIDAVFRTMDDVAAETRKIRLELDKLVAKRKEERRTEIGNAARRAVIDHIHAINETLGAHAVPMPATLIADLQAAIKGKRSFSSMQDAVDTVANNAKITASQAADRIRANIRVMDLEMGRYAALFPDAVQLCSTKSPEDLRNLMDVRITQHKKAEQQRLDDEREKIRKEEEARAQKKVADDAAAAAAEQAAQAAQPVAAEQQPGPVASAAAAAPVRTAPTAVASAPAPAAAPREVVKIKLGDINARIAPLSISADGLALLGFKPINATGAAKLYDQAQFPAMCRAMIDGLQDAANSYPLAA